MTQGYNQGEPLESAITSPQHAAINHAGLPGVGDLSAAGHALLDHAGLPGVGNLATAPGAGLVDHSTLDHSAIPGVGGTLGSEFTVLDVGVTAAQISAALASYRIVYLKPGNYGVMTATIQIPPDKQLICLTGGGPVGSISYGAILQINSNITLINMQGRNRIEGISFWGSEVGTSNLVDAGGGSNSRHTIKNCFFNVGAWQGRLLHVSNSYADIENVGFEGFSRTGTASVLRLDMGGGSGSSAPSTLKNVYVNFPTTGASARMGIEIQAGGVTLLNCKVSYAGSHGFYFSISNNQNITFLGCSANNCGGDGFYDAGPGWWLSMIGCFSYQNTGRGFYLPFGTAGRWFGVISSCVAQANAGGNIVSTGYHNSANAFF